MSTLLWLLVIRVKKVKDVSIGHIFKIHSLHLFFHPLTLHAHLWRLHCLPKTRKSIFPLRRVTLKTESFKYKCNSRIPIIHCGGLQFNIENANPK